MIIIKYLVSVAAILILLVKCVSDILLRQRLPIDKTSYAKKIITMEMNSSLFISFSVNFTVKSGWSRQAAGVAASVWSPSGLAVQWLVARRRNIEAETVRWRDVPTWRSTERSGAQSLDDCAIQSLQSAVGQPSSACDGPTVAHTHRVTGRNYTVSQKQRTNFETA